MNCRQCKPEHVACIKCGCGVCGNKDGRYGCKPQRCGSSFTPDGRPLPEVKMAPPARRYDSEHIKDWAKEHGLTIDGFQVADLLFRLSGPRRRAGRT